MSESDYGRSWRARGLGIAIVVVAVAGAGIAVGRHWPEFLASWRLLDATDLLAGALLGLTSLVAAWLGWRSVLEGIHRPWSATISARVFFVSQLGKYAPGSVWPLLIQVEAGRRNEAAPGTMVAANLLSTVVNLVAGITVGATCLAISDRATFDRYWWVLLIVPVLALTLVPSVLRRVLARLYGIARREAPDVTLDPGTLARSLGWSLVMWATIGLQTALLASALGAQGSALVPTSVGATALAICLGVLFLPAPAGSGVREVVLGVALATLLTTGGLIAIVAASRALAALCDVTAGLVAHAAYTAQRRRTTRKARTLS